MVRALARGAGWCPGYRVGKNDRAASLDLALSMPRRAGTSIPAGRPFIYDFPASHAALARIRPGDPPPLAERFELFLGGMELANGFHELTDAAGAGGALRADLAARRARGLVEPPPGPAPARGHGARPAANAPASRWASTVWS
jgi:elongation factor P--beta-lysine ligase